MTISFKKTIVRPSSSVKACINKINQLKFKCLIVVDKNKVLLGSLTDGDIRRAILKNKKIHNSNIKNIYYKKTFFVKENNFSKTTVLKKIKDEDLIIVPVLNSQFQVIKILNVDNLKTKKTNKKNNLPEIPIVIMAGGKGTRLSPFTEILPKPLIPIKSKTALEMIIENYTKQNQKKFYISVNYKSEIIKAYFNELKPNYKLNFIEEKKPLGTAGSLYLLKKKLKKSFILCNCDILANYDLRDFYDFHENNKNDITILSSVNSYQIPYGVLSFDKYNRFEKIIEKPIFKNNINVGIYIIRPKVLHMIKENEYLNFTDLVKNAKKNKLQIGIFKIQKINWKDIGEWDKYNNFLKNSK